MEDGLGERAEVGIRQRGEQAATLLARPWLRLGAHLADDAHHKAHSVSVQVILHAPELFRTRCDS